MSIDAQISDDSKVALEDFLKELILIYYPWYVRSARIHYLIAIPLQIIALMAGFLSSILAALTTAEHFAGFGTIRVSLILLPALGSAATAIAVQSKLYDRLQLRENGRLAIQSVYNEGRVQYASAINPQDFSAIHAELVKKVEQIETDQSSSFFKLVGSRMPQRSHRAVGEFVAVTASRNHKVK